MNSRMSAEFLLFFLLGVPNLGQTRTSRLRGQDKHRSGPDCHEIFPHGDHFQGHPPSKVDPTCSKR